MKKQTLTWLTVAIAIYHLAAVIKDAEQWAINARRVRADPSPANVTKLLIASGVLITDFRAI